jgi:succinate-semialdehyde dehydrogenase/glutarate-semialdehyde dehydrogenase
MATFRTTNPSTGETINEYSYWNASQISSSLAKSERSHQKWRSVLINDRLSLLDDLKKNVDDQKQELAFLAVLEMGKTLAEALSEVEKCSKLLSFYREHAMDFLKEKNIQTEHQRSFVTYRPLGTILCIMPWNFPYWQVFRAAIPALVSGNAVLLKHADNTSGSALKIEELMKATNMPSSLFQTLLVDHDQVVGIIKSSTVSAVSLTGSEKAGRSVGATAGSALKKCVMELGGSDPYIIFPDADIKKSAEICMKSRLINNGQSCIAAKRFIIHKDIYNQFKEECIAIVSRKKIGDPSAPETHIGPLAKESILTETKKQVKDSIDKGATIAFESKDLPEKGFFHPIMILENVKKGQPVFDGEVFAPVASFVKFSSTEEAISIANDHRYGLGAAVFTKDLKVATDIASNRIESGFVSINSLVASDPRLPFGGIKDSGYGRELSVEGMLEFVNTKTIVVNT